MQFREVSVIKSNITSSLDLRLTYDKFGVITRQLAPKSSKWVYRLEIYDYNKLQKESSIDIYESYTEEKHYIKFVSDKNLIVVTTKNQIRFYQIEPLLLLKNYLHGQNDVYDLQSTVDGELVILVGEQINIWRTNGLRRIHFPHSVNQSRKCAFSRDSKYLAISSINQIKIFGYVKNMGQFQFLPLNRAQSPTSKQEITSIEFNPTDSNQIIVGFLNLTPQFFKIDQEYFIPAKDIQPLSANNKKKAVYMPDGKRFMSSDVLNGIGIWPGFNTNLFYREGYLLYNIMPDAVGSRFLGCVWQQIKLVQIQVLCQPQNFLPECACSSSQSWDYASYSCQPLECFGQNTTGQTKNNQCDCKEGYIFNKALRKCVIDCGNIENAVRISPDNGFCFCSDSKVWDKNFKKCVFNCKQIAFSTGKSLSKEVCECQTGFIWSQQFKECICPPYSYPMRGHCVCYENYVLANGRCLADCRKIDKSIGFASSDQECECEYNYYFTEISLGKVGCKLNCSLFPNTYELSPGTETCLCLQNMSWFNGKCQINCSEVAYASGYSSDDQNVCNCAVNYLWIDEIHECARNCSGLAYINSSKHSTLKNCPCINNFNWDTQELICKIDCTKINNANPYNLSNPSLCECRNTYDWIPDSFKCQVNCSKIWDARQRIDEHTCSCNSGKVFNPNRMTCDLVSAAGFFQNIWNILALVAGLIVLTIISITLLRYCWQFKTTKKQEQGKKIKIRDRQKNKWQNLKKTQNLFQHNLLSDDRMKVQKNIKL